MNEAIAAREAAQAVLRGFAPASTAVVELASRGRLLIVGPQGPALDAAARLKDRLECTVFVEGRADGGPELPPDVRLAGQGRLRGIEGHFGAFRPVYDPPGGAADAQERTFDLVLDLNEPTYRSEEVLPIGYFGPRGSEEALERALEELPELVGEFEKPRFFEYSSDICAHARRGVQGCSRCIEACAASAILPAGDGIEVDPNLCQGCGGCSTSCPTGAIRYAYPRAGDLLDVSRRALRAFREADGAAPVVVIHDSERGAEAAGSLPARALPLPVEDAGSVGPEAWLAMVAYGAARVAVLLTPQTPGHSRAELAAAMRWVGPLLEGVGLPADTVRTVESDPDSLAAVTADVPELPFTPATFAAMGRKREILRLAVEHLLRNASSPPEAPVELPEGAPYGTVEVDRDACTLCMACVSVCPASALEGGGDAPQLRFWEDRCVQCGICEQACPEDAIGLRNRFDYGAQTAPEPRLLNEEKLFHCVRCNKPFATEKIMARMTERLSGHWMFADERARERLQMCEDCRVRDLLAAEGGMDGYR